ncbi:MAG: ferredoxin [Candidatus Nomurabacteria bacterium]|nr:MAG: ferredoxin [Candidatus Nomurabacteria bacterium]
MADKDKKIGKIELDQETCISAASCVALAAKTFQLDGQGKVEFVDKEHPIGDEEEMILEAAKSCPVDAIKLFDQDGKQMWPEV